jgi:hypothetical protein
MNPASQADDLAFEKESSSLWSHFNRTDVNVSATGRQKLLPFKCGLPRFSAGLATAIGRLGRQSKDGPQGLAGIVSLEIDHWK